VTLFHKSESFCQHPSARIRLGTAIFASGNPSLQKAEEAAIDKFCSEIDAVLQSDNPQDKFLSFTLRGVKAPRKTKNMSELKRAQLEKEKENLRGKIREVQGRLLLLKSKTSVKNTKENKDDGNLFLQTTIKYHGATDVAQNFKLCDDFRLKNVLLSETSPKSEWGNVEGESNERTFPFLSAEMKTVDGTWMLDLTQSSTKGKLCKFIKTKKALLESSSKPLAHDIPKKFVLSPSLAFFQKLGITDENGKPKLARTSKLRQCQKFVEIVSRLVESSNIANSGSNSNHDDDDHDIIKVVDMGCGRGYLTFSLHSYLYDKYANLKIESRGVDVRPKLMEEVNTIARELGESFDGLQFMTGTIENAEIEDGIDILIALHACDTATDDAIWYGIKKNSTIIVTAPCCHKQIRMYLDAHVTKAKDHPYVDILRHNIYKERIAETVTDSMRALLLEIAGYDVQVFEFIGGEHTSKNVMITAVKRSEPRSQAQKDNLRQRLNQVAKLHGIQRQKLADLLGETLGDVEDEKNSKYNRNGMPKL